MLFQTLSFFAFLAITLALYWRLPRARLALLALANALFYLAAGPTNLILFLGASALTYLMGQRVTGPGGRGWLALGIALNLANLAYFKYAGFLASNLYDWLHFAWLDPQLLRGLLLPIGISFYTFQHISYLVDRRVRDLPPAPNYLHFWVYISFFGHSIAGPIMRGHEFFPQLAAMSALTFDRARLRLGAGLFALGLVKKVAIATPLAGLVDGYFETPLLLSGGEAWVAALLFTFQIYYDFSAYSDMAVGIGHMFGVVLPQNFRTPYVSANASEFWTRWHVTLSQWIRDYVYIPLGGNRTGAARAQLNLLLAMLASGLWHGANWTFVFWGAYHGLLLLGQRGWARLRPEGTPRVLAVAGFFALTVFGWVLFRCRALEDAFGMWQAMLNPFQLASFAGVKRMLLLCAGLYALHWLEYALRRDEALGARWWWALPVPVRALVYTGFALYFMVAYDGAQAFIYFRF